MTQLFLFLFLAGSTFAAVPFQKAVVRETVGSVQKISDDEPTTAGRGTKLEPTDKIRTQAQSRAELLLNDQSLVRLGANTLFSFEKGKRELNLTSGEALIVVTKGLGGATITTPTVTAAVQGTTIYIKFHDDERIYACLEGKCRIGTQTLTAGQRLVVPAGQKAKDVPVTSFNPLKFLKENPLGTDYPAPLPSQALIEAEAPKP
jgi:hypothetical protein